jgi:inorganic pyrophosphatase
VIADNVGDNVGDVAGMGADLFESFVGAIIAAATLAINAPFKDQDYMMFVQDGNSFKHNADVVYPFICLPFWLASAGVLSSIIGCFFVSTKQEGAGWNVKLSALMWALEKGMYVAGFLFLGMAAAIIVLLFGADGGHKNLGWKIYACIMVGMVSGMLIGKVTEYFTSFDFGPVISIKDRGTTGPATVVIQGIGVGMISCVPPTIVLVVCIIACDALAGEYGVSISAVGMLATLGITLATDAYGPVADNAGGLAEMAGLGPDVRAKTDSLDALGNTTAATGKGFAIGSAVLTALSLLNAYKDQVNVKDGFDLGDPLVLSGLLFGAMMPFLFAALTMISVGKAAAEIIQEVRNQFDNVKNENGYTLRSAIEKASRGEDIPPEEDVKPNSDRCVLISTRSSVKEMIAPGCYSVLVPVTVGFTVGPKCLMGVLAGALVTGCMLAIMMSNAGGAWDNSKKLCEKLKIKKTDQGKACVVGDTVGDPFKDTSGPALNILIKLMSIVSLTIAPLIGGKADWDKWYLGLIPFAIFLLITVVLVYKQILTWKDPLGKMINEKEVTTKEVTTAEVTNKEEANTGATTL